MWSVALLGLAAHAAEPIRPARLAREAALIVDADHGDQRAVIDNNGMVWAGESRLTLLPPAGFTPTALASGEVTVGWRVTLDGLAAETRVALWSGVAAPREARVDTRVLAVAVDPSGAVVAIAPGELLVWRSPDAELLRLPLHHSAPPTVRWIGTDLQIQAPDGARFTLTPASGCVGEERRAASPWAQWAARQRALICGKPGPLPDDIVIAARAEMRDAAWVAVSQGDGAGLAAAGIRASAQIAALRPQSPPADGRYSALDPPEPANVPDGLLGRRGGVVIRVADPAMDLLPWVEGAYAPACEIRVLLQPVDARTAQALNDTAGLVAGASCAVGMRVLAPGTVDLGDDWSWLVNTRGEQVGKRNGPPVAAQVRLDLARARGEADPLSAIAEVPELSPNWTVDGGAGSGLAIDIDGSWASGVGWDLARGSPDLVRLDRIPLGGPAGAPVSVQPDGRFLVAVGSQAARVDVEAKQVEWIGPASALPTPALPRDAADWKATARGAQRAKVRIDTGLPVTNAQVLPGGVILETPLGLLGYDDEGALAWRITAATEWALVRGWLYVTTPWGVHGYRPPP